MALDGSDHQLPTTEHLSVCRCCGALCGIVVSVRGGKVLAVRGDDDHPVSRGYVCPKGRALPRFQHSPDRLAGPRLDGRPAPWTAVLDDLAARMADLRERHGPDGVGHYTSTGQYFDTAAVQAESGFYSALGTRQRYTAATVDCAPTWRAAELVTGFAKPFHPVWVPEDPAPGLVVMIGFNPVVSHVYFGAQLPDPVRRIREYRARGGEVWVIDPRRSETAALADRHLAARPDTDALVLAWLVRELLAEGGGADTEELTTACDPAEVTALRAAVAPFDRALVSDRAGVDEGDLDDLLAAIRRHGQIAAISGTGINFSGLGVVTEWLRWALLVVTGSLDRPGGMRFPVGETMALEAIEWSGHAPADGSLEPGPASRPELGRWLGEYPCVALVDEIEAGTLRGLIVAGGSPLTAFPDPDRTRAALASLEVLAVVDVVENELTAMATHVLPARGQLERSDLLRSHVPAVAPPVGDSRPGWWIVDQLARRLGLDALPGLPDDGRDDPDGPTEAAILRRAASASRDGADALLDAGPRGLRPPAPVGWVHERVLPDGRWRLAPAVMLERLAALLELDQGTCVLVSHRVMHSHNSVPYSSPPGGPGVPTVDVCPEDAARWGVADGDAVRVASATGTLDGAARLDRRMRPGTVSINHGWLRPNVARLVASDGIDPLSGQPAQTGIAVTVERLVPIGAATVPATDPT